MITKKETLQIINDFVDDYEKWALEQHSPDPLIEFMRFGWIHNLANNVYSKFIRNTQDQIYWLNRSSEEFQKKFDAIMPEELKYKLFIINLLK